MASVQALLDFSFLTKSVIFRLHATVDCINQYFIPSLILREREVFSVLFFFLFPKAMIGFFLFLSLMEKDKPHVDLDQMRFAHV